MSKSTQGKRPQSHLGLLWTIPSLCFYCAFLLSLLCKLFLLKSRELWLDETYSSLTASMNLQGVLRFSAGDVHPQLYPLLLWGWVHLAGNDSARLRLSSVLLSACCMIAMYVFGRHVIGEKWGSFAAILFAFSPMLLVYSLEVRSYTLFLLIFLCALIAYWRVVMQERNGHLPAAGLALLLAALFYVHYLAIFLIAGLFIHWLIRGVTTSARTQLSTMSLVLVLTSLLVIPGASLLIRQHRMKADQDRNLEVSHRNPEALSFDGSMRQPSQRQGSVGPLVVAFTAMAGFYPAPSKVIAICCAIPLLCTLIGVAYYGLWLKDETCRLVLVLIASLLAGVALLGAQSTRYVLPLAPPLMLAIARVLQLWSEKMRMRYLALAVAVGVVMVYGAGFMRQATKREPRPWTDLVETVQKAYQPGDIVIFDVLYAQVPFDYFGNQRGFHPRETGFPISIYDWWTMQDHRSWGGPVIFRSDLDRKVAWLTAQHPDNVWIVAYETYYYDPQERLLSALANYGEVERVPLGTSLDSSTPSQEGSGLRLFKVSFHR